MQSIFQNLHIDIYNASRKILTPEWRTENFAKRFRIVPWSRFYLPLDGEAFYEFNGETHVLRKGMMLVIPPFLSTIAHCDSSCDLCWINFNAYPEKCQVDLFSLYHPPWELPVEDFYFSKRLFFRILEVSNVFRASGDPAVRAAAIFESETLFKLLLLPFIFAAEKHAAINSDNNIFFPLLNYIESHLHENITLEKLAKFCNINPTYLTNLFSSRIGIPLIHYCKMRKLTKARLLVETTDMSISEIAYSLGMSDPNNFGRFFKKYYDISPANLRKLHNKR